MRACLAAWAAAALVSLLVSKSLSQHKVTPVYVGCFKDQAAPNRDMQGLVGISQLGPFSVTYMAQATVRRDDMTVDLCSEICTYGGFRYAGVQAYTDCTCDSSYGFLGPAPESDCMYPCRGNASQICGGPYRNSIYENVYSFGSQKLRRFRKIAASAAPSLVTSGGSQGWSITTRSLVMCAGFCARTASCVAYRFNESSGLCQLSSFAALFMNETGEAWIAV